MTMMISIRSHRTLFMACYVFLCVLLSATLFMAWTAHSSRRYIPLPTNVIIDYTDTSLQVNTAHLSRMLLPDAYPLKQYHTMDELVELTKSTKVSATVTAVLFFGPNLGQQMKSVQKQSVSPQSIWIICATENDRTAVKQAHAITLRELASLLSTDYVWLLDPGAVPQSHHLELLLATSQTKMYENAIVGPGSTSTKCESSTTRLVDTIFSSWLLRRTWIDVALIQSLQTNRRLLPTMLTDIRRIGLPTPSKEEQEQENGFNIVNNQIDMCSFNSGNGHKNDIQDNIAFMVSDRYHLNESWMRLVCAFVDRSRTAVHVIIPGAGTPGTSFNEVTKAFQKHHSKCFASLQLYDLELPFDYSQEYWPPSSAMQLAIRTSRLLDAIQPQILIHQREERALEQALPIIQNEMHTKTTIIGLPPNCLKHVLWMKDLEFSSLQRWHDVSIKVIVLISGSDSSLLQLLRSLQNALYLGDKVDISMFLEYDADAISRRLAEHVAWHHGTKAVRHRIVPVDRARMMLESWYPSNNNEYGVILDDGLHLSPLFYIWAKYAILKYGQEPALYGVSLSSTRIIDTSLTPRYLDTPDGNAPYLMQSPSSLGAAVYFPEHWRELHDYMTARMVDVMSNGQQTIQVPATRSANWTFSWRRYVDELVYLRGYVMLYPNFHDGASFATRRHWLDSKHEAKLTEIYKSPLLRESPILDQLPDHELPEWRDLVVMDLWGEVSTLKQLHERGLAFHNQISACPPSPLDDHDPSDLLCPFGFIIDQVDPKKKKNKKKKTVTVYRPQPTRLPLQDSPA